jgi:hypothetical protein
MKNAAPRTDLRIVHQARTAHGGNYHLACEEHRLVLEFSSTEGENAEWTLVAIARERSFAQDVRISARGPTRSEALRAVAHIGREDALNYPTFDWVAIEGALHEVKAL